MVGPEDDFVSLGGDSLIALRVSRTLVKLHLAGLVEDTGAMNAALGGDTGDVTGAFGPENLVRGAPSLHAYARMLREEVGGTAGGGDVVGVSDSDGGGGGGGDEGGAAADNNSEDEVDEVARAGHHRQLVRALWEATAAGEAVIVTEMLDLGASVDGVADGIGAHGGAGRQLHLRGAWLAR